MISEKYLYFVIFLKSTDKILKEITFYLGYEATRDLNTSSQVITTPMNGDLTELYSYFFICSVQFEGAKIKENIAIVPILRAGLSMADGMLELIPNAVVHHIGLLIVFSKVT